jgi:4-amino-4-deoxy-L-arabinose transferase-like glycosyltransferase/membrane-associated phospholipid phosphatase
MAWLLTLDTALFRFINLKLANPLFDWLMPRLSALTLFFPLVGALGAFMIWKWRARGLVCAAMLAIVIGAGDPLVINQLKKAVDRPRPFAEMPDVRLLVGRGRSASFPSSHAASWFAATMIALVYFRRSVRVMLPLASAVAFSRIYNGVHYPSDVLAGAVLGAGYAAAGVVGLNALWQWAGRRWFPWWWQKFPSLLVPEVTPAPAAAVSTPAAPADHWLRLGYLVIGLLLARLAYLASGTIELSEDEAYQWLWSKHLDLSYYSKPPMIAYAQFLGTSLWGDTEFGVRFLSPVLAAVLGVVLLRFFAREVSARAGFWLVLIITATPLAAVGSTLITIDPLNVFFWTLAMVSGWRAVQHDSTRLWLWTGLWMGLSFLSKYTGLFQWLSWAVFFALWPAARGQLRRPGPWLALGVNALCTLPVLIWNAQHGWITLAHLSDRSGLHKPWSLRPGPFFEFLGAEAALLNPVFFVAAAWAAVAIWRRAPRHALAVFCFSMGVPVFVIYGFYTLRARVQPNWIAPAVLPLLCLAVIHWEERWRQGARAVARWLAAGLVSGLAAVVVMHDTGLISRLTGVRLPPKSDPLRRVSGSREMARIVNVARQRLAAEGRPVFVIGDHYGLTALLTFYLPEAKAAVRSEALVYYQSTDFPRNQFYFWPGYRGRRGHHAIYVRQAETPGPAPPSLREEFESVTDLGMHEVQQRGRTLRRLQLFACRNLR